MSRRRFNLKRKRPIRRRQYRKKMRKATTAIIRSPSVVPDRMKLKLRYTDVFSITVNGGVQNYQLFSGNSIYDPDATGVGHQPFGHDQ